MTLILGTKSGDHDPCFVLVRDGTPLFIYEQERFSRLKRGYSCSMEVALNGLREYGYEPRDIDYVTSYLESGFLKEKYRLDCNHFAQPNNEIANRLRRRDEWMFNGYVEIIRSMGIPRERIVTIRHHMGHCAGVFYPSPFEEAAILSIDGSGEVETVVLAHGEREKIRFLETNPYPHSLGMIYEATTRWLGWAAGEDGKTMALASYGSPRHVALLAEKCLQIDDRGFFRYLAPMTAYELIPAVFGPGRGPGEPFSTYHLDVAASVQAVVDDIVLRLARTLRELTRAKHVLVAGGVGLNSVANGRLMKAKIFETVTAYPQANDSGTALGGALWVHYNVCGEKRIHDRYWRFNHAYWGKPIDVENVETVAREYGLTWRRPERIAAAAASLIAQGKVIGWVQGRAEVGPRALGNRSILADPRRADLKDHINARVKNREVWRPFAPSVLEEECAKYFETDQALPYMIIVCDAKPEWRDRLRGVCHVDGTARVQTVTKATNPLFYELLCEVKERTGLGMVLNTSFNTRREPLVQTARQAVENFLRMELDALVIGDYLFESKPANADVPPFHPFFENIHRLSDVGKLLVVYLNPHAGIEHFFAAAARHGIRFSCLAPDPVAFREQVLTDPVVREMVDQVHGFDAGLTETIASYDSLAYFVGIEPSDWVLNLEAIELPLFRQAETLLEKGKRVFFVFVMGEITEFAHILRIVRQRKLPPAP